MFLAFFFPKLSHSIALITIEVNSVCDYLLKFLFLASSLYLLFYLYRKFLGVKISKISFKNAELVTKSDTSNISVINRHIDELLYFFEATKTNVVFY